MPNQVIASSSSSLKDIFQCKKRKVMDCACNFSGVKTRKQRCVCQTEPPQTTDSSSGTSLDSNPDNSQSTVSCLSNREYFLKIVECSSLGYFSTLPLELRIQILKYMDVSSLGNVALTSKEMRNTVDLYRTSTIGLKSLMPNDTHQVIPLEKEKNLGTYFQQLAIFMKRLTCLWPTSQRLKAIEFYLHKLTCSSRCSNIMACSGFLYYGTFLHTMIAGWDDTECSRVYDFIKTSMTALKYISKLFKCKPGTFPRQELQTRLLYRRGLLDVLRRDEDKMFWLDFILDFPMVLQARLLYILYGPICNQEHIDWTSPLSVCPVTKAEVMALFKELSDAFQILKIKWSEDSLISVLDEITGLPGDWHPENMAHLILLCGDEITLRLLGSKAINRRLDEISELTAYLAIASIKQEKDISTISNIIWKLCKYLDNPQDRTLYIRKVLQEFRTVIIESEYAIGEDVAWNALLKLSEEFAKSTGSLMNSGRRFNINLKGSIYFDSTEE